VAELRLDANVLAETLSKIQLNAVSGDLDQAAFPNAALVFDAPLLTSCVSQRGSGLGIF